VAGSSEDLKKKLDIPPLVQTNLLNKTLGKTKRKSAIWDRGPKQPKAEGQGINVLLERERLMSLDGPYPLYQRQKRNCEKQGAASEKSGGL